MRRSLARAIMPRSTSAFCSFSTIKPPSPATKTNGDDEWNDAWEMSWLPSDPLHHHHDPSHWDTTTSNATNDSSVVTAAAAAAADMDSETKAFVGEMDERWAERRAAGKKVLTSYGGMKGHFVEHVEGKNKKAESDEYRVKKQRIHAGLWVKEIERLEEAKLGGTNPGDDIDKLLDSCAEIFDSGNIDSNALNSPTTNDFKTKPDGWESTSKKQDGGNIWDVTQREEDILLQEFERRIAFSKFQIASFIKSHIFSRRRPVDGWKYMIEVIGPNARKGKGSVPRLPTLSDPSTEPYREEKPALSSFKRK